MGEELFDEVFLAVEEVEYAADYATYECVEFGASGGDCIVLHRCSDLVGGGEA